MADLQTTVDLIFQGKDQVSEVIGKIDNGLSTFGDSAKRVTGPLVEITQGLAVMEASLVAVSLAITGKAIDAAGKFETSFKFITTLFDESGASVAQFRDDILDYAAGSTQSLESITAALQTAIGSGVKYADSLGVLGTAERLAVAQGGELDATIGLLVGTLNGYGLKMEEAGKVSDQFSVIIRDGKISVGELASQMANITPLAAAAGVGLDQIGAGVAVLTAQGFLAGPAITGLKQILEGLIKPTGQASDYAESLGLKFNAQALAADGLQGVLQKVFAATGGNVDKMAQLFTTSEGLGAALALGGKGADQFAKELLTMKDSAGTTDAAFAKMADTVTNGADAFKVLLINIGTPLLDEFSAIQSGIIEITKGIGASFKDGGSLRPLTADLESWGKDVANVLSIIAKNLPEALKGLDLTGIISSIQESRNVVTSLLDSITGGADLTSVEGLRTAIQNIINGVEIAITAFNRWYGTINQVFENFKNSTVGKYIIGIFDDLPKAADKSNQGVKVAQQDFGRIIDDYIQSLNDMHNKTEDALFGVESALKNLNDFKLTPPETGPWIDKLKDIENIELNIKPPELDINPVQRSAGEIVDIYSDTIFKLGQIDPTGVVADKAAAATDRYQLSVKSVDGSIKDLSGSISQGEFAAGKYKVTLDSWNDGVKVATRSIEGFVEGHRSASKEATELEKAQRSLGDAFGQSGADMGKITGALNEYMSALGQSGKLTTDQFIELTKVTSDFKAKMEELASNERIKNLEFTAEIITTKLETDAKRVEATFASIDTSINSTGELLSNLFDNLTKTSSSWDKNIILDQIEKENQRRQDALDLQKKLAEAEIARIEAQTESLNRGDALIQIDGKGLAPELEAFMWKILGTIRTRANAEFADYLLGVGAT